MKNFGKNASESIALPLDPQKKIDHRGIVPVNQCKVITVSENPAGLTSEEKAAREELESQQRIQDKQRANEDFLKKTKERLKEKRIKEAKALTEPDLAEPAENVEIDRETFTFMDQPNARNPDLKTSQDPSKKLKTPLKPPKKQKKPEENPIKPSKNEAQDDFLKHKIPRFVSVDNMKVEFNPKMVKKSETNKKFQDPSNYYFANNSCNSLPKPTENPKILEQARFSVALKTLVSSKMEKKFPNTAPVVCTCGAASKNTAKHPKKCANNCPFYKREADYQKALKEMLTSFKASE